MFSFWGWEVVLDMFLGGLAAGVMIVSVITPKESRAARLLPFVAPVAVSIALLALFLDLENKRHVFRFFTTLRVTSPMSWGAWILLLVYPATILYGLARIGVPFARRHETFLARANVVLGIALGSYTGILLTTTARPAWNSITLAPLFLVSAVVTGAAACKLVSLNSNEQGCVCRCLVRALFAELALLFAWFIDLGAVRTLFFGGPYTAAMWSLVVIAGLAVPALLQTLELRGRTRPAMIAPLLILVGSFALRWIVIAAGEVGHA